MKKLNSKPVELGNSVTGKQASGRIGEWVSQILAASATFVSRLGFLPANLSPLGSYGFFGNPALYLISIVAFDALVGGFYKGFWFTYAGFTAYAGLGYVAGRHLKRQVALLPLASFAFFLLSNLGTFWYWYPHTWEGLLTCYALALPFYSRTLLGDLLFGYGYLAYKNKASLTALLHRFTFDTAPAAQ